jgi:SAM-dependent methyltransferase
MDAKLIEEKKRRIVEKFGPWTAHNIHLGGDIYTLRHEVTGDETKVKRILQCVSDIAGRPLDSLRVLDLACLEGMYAVEFALHGAAVVAVEGREANIEKARFAGEVLALENLRFVQDDVRNLSKGEYGVFDVVLCLGILYHLDDPDVFLLLENIAEVCQGFLLVDTHVHMGQPVNSYVHRGRTYWGSTVPEHDVDSTPEERYKELWKSLDNPEAVFLTRNSLYNALAHVGFTSVYECHIPHEPKKPNNRITLLAVKGEQRQLLTSPLLNAQKTEDLADGIDNRDAQDQAGHRSVLQVVGDLLAAPGKLLKKMLLNC